MSKAGRIKLGKEWLQKLKANKAGARKVLPKQVDMNHPYIQEYLNKDKVSKPYPDASKDATKTEPNNGNK